MNFLHRLASIASWIVHRNRAERRLDDEIRTFVEMSTAEKIDRGVPAAEARRLAVLELGERRGSRRLYGVTSYAVNLRRTEIGIRMALGATRAG